MSLRNFKRITCAWLCVFIISTFIAVGMQSMFYEIRYVSMKESALDSMDREEVTINNHNSERRIYGILTSNKRSYIDIFKIYYGLLIYDDRPSIYT